jgi:CRP-like cAMP-binding protein
MIDGQGRSATVTAVTPMRAVVLTHATFDELLDEDPGFARGLLLVLCARLREAEQREAAATG